ncbi:MAG: Transcriptional activator FeaR [Pseudomonas citronellolis]|nr:MAG: Transcriptional activator FeaR [Pseudomonas citronellolis]
MSVDARGSWEQNLQDACGPFRVAWRDAEPQAVGMIHGRERQGIGVHHIHTNAQCMAKPRQSVDLADDSHCFIVLQQRGRCRMQLQGVQLELGPGDLLLMDAAGACTVEPLGLIEQVSLTLDRERVRAVLGGAQWLSGALHTASLSGRLLLNCVDYLASHDRPALQPGEGEAIQASLLSLLLPSLKASASLSLQHSALSAQLVRNRASELIERHLDCAELSPSFIAARLAISERSLYRAFQGHDRRVNELIKQRRLEKSAEDLANPHCLHDSVTAIAMRHGFSDGAFFSRAFRQHYGESPSEYRARRIS